MLKYLAFAALLVPAVALAQPAPTPPDPGGTIAIDTLQHLKGECDQREAEQAYRANVVAARLVAANQQIAALTAQLAAVPKPAAPVAVEPKPAAPAVSPVEPTPAPAAPAH